MKYRTPVVAGAFVAALLVFSPVKAAWVEAESENFIYIGNTGESKARTILSRLETYRAAVLALGGVKGAPEVRKVHVYGLRNSSHIEDVTGVSGIGGIYTKAENYPLFVTSTRTSSRASTATAYHEYSHHLLSSYSTTFVPRWYNEGFAEFLGQMTIADGTITVGLPPASVAIGFSLEPSLQKSSRSDWKYVTTVTNAITRYPFDNSADASTFYTMSWVAVHYLQNTAELRDGLVNYLDLLNKGVEAKPAFENGFGIDQAEFAERLRQYWSDNKYRNVKFRAADIIPEEPEIATRKLSGDEVDLALWEPRVIFLGSGEEYARKRASVRTKLLRDIEKHGFVVPLVAALKRLEFIEKNYSAAVEVARRGMEQDPDSLEAAYLLADSLYHRYTSDRKTYASDLPRSREMLAAILEADPSHPSANSHYPDTVLMLGESPDELAIRAARFNLTYNRNPQNFGTYVQAAEIFTAAGQPRNACTVVGRVAQWIRRTSPTGDGASLRDRLDRVLQQLGECDQQAESG